MEETEEKKCDGCNVREPHEHRCHGQSCNCVNLTCQMQQGKLTLKEATQIANDTNGR